MQLVIVRSYVEVAQSPEGLFKLLTSPEGAKILDDTTNHTDPPLATLDWQDRQVDYLPSPCDQLTVYIYALGLCIHGLSDRVLPLSVHPEMQKALQCCHLHDGGCVLYLPSSVSMLALLCCRGLKHSSIIPAAELQSRLSCCMQG